MKESSGRLATELDQALLHERRTALRALLRRPLLAADPRHEAEFLLVRRHADELRDWLARHPGWTLQVDSELARLRKVPASLDDGSRPARDPKSGTPFSKRRYVLLCLALAVLEGADRQTTLGWLADQVVRLVTIDPELERAGIAFDLKSRGQRRDLVHVVRLLHDLRVLARLDGDEELYLKGHGDVLYNIHRPALAAMLNVRRGPSTVEAEGFEQRLAAIVEEPMPESDEARRRRLRSTLTRRLLDDPVLEYEDLDDDELTYLQGQRSFLLGRIRERTGLVPEVRREGIAMVDERDELSDQKMPEKGTDGHLTLLLAEYLAASARRDAGNGSPAVGWAALERHAAELVARHRKHWRKDVSEPGAEAQLCRDAVARLE
ncbi:MAG: TIGR02678 family protein, partial [bacterium]|nr:TIGR02678 family protein [bacterium]